MPERKLAVVLPRGVLTWPDLRTQFQLLVKTKPVAATWSLSNPLVGTINPKTGDFMAAKGLRYPLTDVQAVSSDGKYEGTSQVRIMMGRGTMLGGLQFADNFLKIPTKPWNDRPGRRAAKLILDATAQLPKQFLNRLGDVALIRTDWMEGVAGGMHLPLPGRVVLLPDSTINGLPSGAKIEQRDRDFVRTVVHELGHVVLANDGINDLTRWSFLFQAVLLAGLAVPTWGLSVAAFGGNLLMSYYGNRDAPRDLAYRYSAATGWRIRDPNPIALFWGGQVPPNTVTGFRFVGPLVGLHNEFAPVSDNNLTWNAAGFSRKYSGTDVHEDFADVIATMAMGSPTINHKRFKAARDLIIREGIWPKSQPPIDVGATALGWSVKNVPANPASFEDFGAFLGQYAGAGPAAKKTTIKPRETKQQVSKLQAEMATADSPQDGDSNVGDSSDQDDQGTAPFAEGQGQCWDENEVADAYEFAQRVEKVGQVPESFDEAAPVLDMVREVVGHLTVEIREGTALELLRAAECHGEGLRLVRGAPKAQKLEIDGEIHPGDLLVTRDQTIWVVLRVDEGAAVQVTGMPRLGEKDKVPTALDPADVVLFWHPVPKPRLWFEGQTDDDTKAFARVVRLWGLEEGTSGRALYSAGPFICEVVVAFGKPIPELGDAGDKETLDYCTKHGGVLNPKNLGGPKPRDIVRTRLGKWAFVLRADPLDLVIQGQTKGHIGEDESVVKIVHDVSPDDVDKIWRFAGDLPKSVRVSIDSKKRV